MNATHEAPESSTDDTLIRIDHLSKTYSRGGQPIPVLKDINLAVRRAEFVSLMGPSGSGKSTLLNLIAGIDQPTSGTIRIAGWTLPRWTKLPWPTGARPTWASSFSSTT